MRPALLRLLKRPSALSVLDSLTSAPIGIEQLESRFTCERLRHYSHDSPQGKRIQQAESEQSVEQLNNAESCTRSSLSFRIYEIKTSRTQKARGGGQPGSTHASLETVGSLRTLELQPEKLEFESDIGHTDDVGSRLVDDPNHRHNFALWEELLRYRQRHHGDRGTLDIWEGLMVRVGGVQLPVSGERADFFWQSFVDLGLKQEIVLKELADYASELWAQTGKRWDRLYERVVGGFFARGMTQQALEWHKRLQDPHLSSSNDILCLLKPAINLPRGVHSTVTTRWKPQRQLIPAGLQAFQNICRATNGHEIYADVISVLLQSDCVDHVFRMHTFLVERGDHPRSYEEIRPLIDFAKDYGPEQTWHRLDEYVNDRFPEVEATHGGKSFEIEKDQLSRDQPLESKGNSWVQEKPFKDDFGARLFATKALRFDTILSGLRMFGVTAIGPQSLREMATRAHGCQDLAHQLQEFEKAGISIGDSVFTRLIRRLAIGSRDILLSDLLRSDQHPDVLENAQLQESLLISYYLARDWRQYNMTLVILDEICKSENDLSNVHFRKFLTAGDFKMASRVVDDMALRGWTLSRESIDYMARRILTRRRPGKPSMRYDGSDTKDVVFVVQILRRGTSKGTAIPINLWIELLKRLGMHNRWNDLRKSCLWLASHYSSRSNTPRSAVSRSKSERDTNDLFRPQGDFILRQIFTRHMQAAIVAWGFKLRVSIRRARANFQGPGREYLIPWVRGLTLLRELEQQGVHLSVEWIRRACRHRLAVLYGRRWPSSRRKNRLVRRENPYHMARVIRDIERAWGEPSLFGGRAVTDLNGLVNPPNMTRRKEEMTRKKIALVESIASVQAKDN
ncbi:hypothetical protein BDV25DRAFT_8163 [Aspergillus avenaceus]|uniref:Pentatricopeptide repeat domain-containing protein n=1 Tax=Aspergillus avenaceus TaxID=36643 RepID=A0A5N6TRV7_ASPAV|nr:hypothetical protein BDV25DRAFT_8163 [Aspergillus avenaceus]